MAYLVLARKYRPQRFEDMVGQEAVVRTLANAIALERVHHAFIFSGARGVGKTTTARILARALNCEQGPTASFCGTCATCVEIGAGRCADVIEIDGASHTGVDHIRTLRDGVAYLPSRARFKFYIIDEVHMLSVSAFNALLKTLEEPPPHVKFVLATTEPHKIPVTITSRCQRFDFRRVGVAPLMAHLRHVVGEEGLSLPDAALQLVAREAQGSVRDALSLLDQVLSHGAEGVGEDDVGDILGVVSRRVVFEMAAAVLSKQAAVLLKHLHELDGRGYALEHVADLLLEHFRDLTVAQVLAGQPTEALDRSPEEIEALVAQSAGWSSADLHRLFALMVGVAEDVRRSDYPKLTLEMGLLRLLEVETSTRVETLVTRIDALLGGKVAGSVQSPVPDSASPPSPPTPSVQRRVEPPEAVASGPVAPAPKVAHVPPAVAPNPVAVPAASPPPVPSSGWEAVVASARAKSPALASVWEHASVLRQNAEELVLGYPPGSFYLESVRDADNRAILESAVAVAMGPNVKIAIEAMTEAQASAGPSLAEQMRQARAEQERSVKEQAAQHEAVQQVVSVLDGEIQDIQPLGITEST